MAISNNKLVLSPTLQQNFIDPNTRFPALGKVYFYKAGTTTPKAVYQRSNDSSNPYAPTPNPITLDASGSLSYDIFFYPLDENDPTVKELYDVYVKDMNDVEIFKRLNWPPIDNGVTTGNIAGDFVVNGQFNYPIQFYNPPKDAIGQIDNKTTAVCFGWEYETDANLLVTDRFVTFEEVLKDTFNNLPKYLITLDALAIDNNESINRLSQRLGPVEDLSGKTVTFAFDGMDENGDGIEIDLVLERNYGNPADGASATETIKIDSFTLRSSLTQYVKTFDVPSLNGKTLKGDTSLTLRFELPLQKAVKISLTSVIARLGGIESPEFFNLPVALLNAQIIGQGIDLQQRSAADNFATLSYYNGDFFFQAKTGTYELLDIDAAKAKQNVIILTDADQNIPARGANKYGIPYANLYNIFGTKWGSEGDLEVTSDKTSLTFTSLTDGPPISTDAFSIGNTDWELTEVEKANKFGIKVTKKSASPAVLEFEAAEKGIFSNPVASSIGWADGGDRGGFYYSYSSDGHIDSKTGRPSDHLLLSGHKLYTGGGGEGSPPSLDNRFVLNPNDVFSATDTVKGDENTAWKSEITFLSSSISDYKTEFVTKRVYTLSNIFDKYACDLKYNANTISYSTNAYNVGGTYDIQYPTGVSSPDKLLISFEVDGKSSTSAINAEVIAKVKVKSSDTINTLLDNTVKAVNNPFIEKFAPGTFKESTWIGFGSTTKKYYVFFKVDGVGTDPTPSGRESAVKTGIDLNSTDSVETNLKKIAEAIKLDNFTVPAVDKIFTIPTAAADNVVGVVYL